MYLKNISKGLIFSCLFYQQEHYLFDEKNLAKDDFPSDQQSYILMNHQIQNYWSRIPLTEDSEEVVVSTTKIHSTSFVRLTSMRRVSREP